MKRIRKLKIIIDEKKVFRLSKDPFISLATSIVSQQISVSAARSILSRLESLYPKKKLSARHTLSLKDVDLRAAGLSAQKVIYLKDLAEKFLDGTINPKKFPRMSDDEIIAHLTEVKGVGVWTAHMFLIGTLRRPDVLPIGDLAIKKGFQKVFNLRKLPSDKKMKELAKPYKGNHTRLSHHLWHSLEQS